MNEKVKAKVGMMLVIGFAVGLCAVNLNGTPNETLGILAQGSDYNLSKIQAGKGKISVTTYYNEVGKVEHEEVFSAFEKGKLRWDSTLARYAVDGNKTVVYSPGNNSANFKDVDVYKDLWSIKIDPLGYGVTILGLPLREFINAPRTNVINVREGKLGEEKVYILEIFYPQDNAARRIYVSPNKGFCIVRTERCLGDVPYTLEQIDLKEYPNGAWFFDKYTRTSYKVADGKVNQSVVEWKRELKVLEYELCKDVDDSIFTLKGLGAHDEVTIIDRRFGDLMYPLPAEAQ